MTPKPRRDVVPPAPKTADDYRRLNAVAGQQVVIETPGNVVTDVDGIPLSVGPTVKETAMFAPPPVTRAELARVGLQPGDVPRLPLTEEKTQ